MFIASCPCRVGTIFKDYFCNCETIDLFVAEMWFYFGSNVFLDDRGKELYSAFRCGRGSCRANAWHTRERRTYSTHVLERKPMRQFGWKSTQTTLVPLLFAMMKSIAYFSFPSSVVTKLHMIYLVPIVCDVASECTRFSKSNRVWYLHTFNLTKYDTPQIRKECRQLVLHYVLTSYVATTLNPDRREYLLSFKHRLNPCT